MEILDVCHFLKNKKPVMFCPTLVFEINSSPHLRPKIYLLQPDQKYITATII